MTDVARFAPTTFHREIDRNRRATQHLYIVNPIKSFEERAQSLWDTHPPIGERIRALEAISGQMGSAPAT